MTNKEAFKVAAFDTLERFKVPLIGCPIILSYLLFMQPTSKSNWFMFAIYIIIYGAIFSMGVKKFFQVKNK